MFTQSFDYVRLCRSAVIPVNLTFYFVIWVADTNVNIPGITSHSIEISWNGDSMKTWLWVDYDPFLGFTFTSRIELSASDGKRICQHTGFHKAWLFHLSRDGRLSHCPICKSVGMQVWTQLGRKRDEFCSAVTECTRGWGRALPSTLHITDIVTMLHMARAAHCTLGK